MLRSLLLAISLVLSIGGLPARCARGPALVLIADGAGDFRGLSTAVQHEVTVAALPLVIEPACWSHGYRRSLADQCDRAHARAEGQRLAGKVLAYREAEPGRPIYLMAHSAGAAVVLSAASYLPPDSVERIILLAPTVSPYADIRPALCCSRQGMDVFHSCRDRCAWAVGFTLIGAEGFLFPRIAARIGFRTPAKTMQEDQFLFLKLRQHGWDPSWKCVGHDGGHYGIYQRDFLHARVLPLLTTDR